MRRSGIAIAALVAALATSARAAVFVVNSDSGDDTGSCPGQNAGSAVDVSLVQPGCTLRRAVAEANLNPGADQILIHLLGAPVIVLGATLTVAQDLQINTTVPAGWINAVQPTNLTLRGTTVVTQLIQVSDGLTQLRNITLDQGDLSVLVATSRVLFDQTSGSSTFARVIGGGGALEKRGAGTLILTGVNSYGGSTTIGEGTLQGDTESIRGGDSVAAARDITDNGVLIFDQDEDDPANFFGEIDGTGRLIKDGPGTLFLQNPDNDYAGGTTITQGTLEGFANGTSGSLQGNIVNNAALTFVQPNDAVERVFSGNISGNGSVTKEGASTLRLTGANSFRGLLDIQAGNVIGSTRSIPGDVLIESGSNLQFLQENADGSALNGTHSGNISSDTSVSVPSDTDIVYTVTKSGPGTLTLTGLNTYQGGTLVEQGTLAGTTQSLQRTISLANSTALLVFSQDFDGVFAGTIRGLAGALAKSGAGAVTISESQFPTFTPSSATAITGGSLVIGSAAQGTGVNTRLPGDVIVGSEGTLSGIGSVDGNVTASGTIAPVGILTVGGVTFNDGSVLAVRATDPGTGSLVADRLRVAADGSGTATIASGATLRLALGSLDRDLDYQAVVLDAGTLTAPTPPFSVAQDFAFFTVGTSAAGGDVSVVLLSDENRKLDRAPLATTPNQRAVGAALEKLDLDGAAVTDDVDTVFRVLGGMSVSEVTDALDQMAGEQLTQFATTRLAIDTRFHSSLQERIRGVAWGDGEALLAHQGPGAAPVLAANPILQHEWPGFAQGNLLPTLQAGQAAPSMTSVLDSDTRFPPAQGEQGFGAWIDGYGLFGALSGDSGTTDLDYTIGGFSVGLDKLLAEHVLLGAAGGYAYSDLDFDGLSGSQNVNSGQGALYAGYVLPWLQAGASLLFGYSSMESTREIDFMGRSADADFDGWDLGGHVEAALDLAKLGPVEIQPLASFTYTHVQQDEIDESGADSLDLDTDEEEVDSAVSGLGLRAHGVFLIYEDMYFHPELSARWLHEFGDTERELTARIGGMPGATFLVQGTDTPSDTGVFGVSWAVVVSQRLHVFADYDIALASELVQHSAAVGLKLVW